MSENVYLTMLTRADRGKGREWGKMKHSMPKLVTQQSISDEPSSLKCQSKPFGCDTPTPLINSNLYKHWLVTFTSPLIDNLPNGCELKCV